MSHSKTGGENKLGESNPSSIAVSAAVPNLFSDRRKPLERGMLGQLSETAVILQIGGGVIPSISEGMSILLLGLFGAVTLLAMKLKSALALLAWGLAGVMLVLAILGVVPIEIYFMAIVFSMLAIAATGAYIATHA